MTVFRTMRLRNQSEGDVGIEIEVEGNRLPTTDQYWRMEHDGSLRGNSREYVLERPMSLSEARSALDYLAHRYKVVGSSIQDSARCGVHVHVNCQSLSMLHLYNFMTLYLIFEEMLVKWCGPYREGNLFCLRTKDAEYTIQAIIDAAETGHYREVFHTDELRYASMNLKALATYGSLEFRAMRGTEDVNLIYQWAEMLIGLREAAKSFENPREIIMSTSEGGSENFLLSVFSEENAKMFLRDEECQSMMVDGVRRSQEIAFCIDWENFSSGPKRNLGGIEVEADFEDDFPPQDM